MHNIVTREIEYTAHDGKTLIGFFAAPETNQPVAGIILGPEWWGRDAYMVERAKQFAQQGYASFAIDMYGNKASTELATEASAYMNEVFEKPNTLVDRAQAALATLAAQPEVDPKKLAAIGFCFGGKIALELARIGAPLDVIASFHGTLKTNNPAKTGLIKGDVLVCHGVDDSMIPLEDVDAIEKELKDADVSYQILRLEGAKHGFANPKSDERHLKTGVDLAYSATAEQQSLEALAQLLKKRFASQ
ncbi:dienelactone hydrolase family protein [Acinetobacter rathckeae]|uniref:dienelactone hydrolase family protein n=1 Tax=Acinetobacter rathckeae TaxID=2605272 RepID=UPI0018A29DA7|nr:dienelactone hydrolase family protein [Acinetobacter rathckeae]MBF7688099.1 dienelactone hydrolase family protein [Acinetobacter rathckeae]MBF7695389.1 dienelactone hydrolase family protein [Acinetobacter rathckeae]